MGYLHGNLQELERREVWRVRVRRQREAGGERARGQYLPFLFINESRVCKDL